MDLRQLLIIMHARMRVIIWVLLTTVAVAVVISLLLPKTYTATATVVVDAKADPVNGVMLPVLLMPGYLATQVDIITSQRVALEAVTLLRLAESPVAKRQFQEATDGRGSINNWLADLLLKKIKVNPARESSVINIEYRATDPQFAAAVANAFAQGYIATNLGLRVEPARQTAQWFSGQSKILRENLENAQAKLSQYQRDKGIVSTDERLDSESARLADLSSQLVVAQGVTYDSQNRERKAKELITSGASTDELAEVLNQPVIVGLKSDVSRAEAKIQEMQSQYGKNHPQLLQAQANLAELKRKLELEIANVTKGLTNTNAINQHREAEIRGSLEAQRRRVLAEKERRDEMQVLMREVDAAQKAFDAATSRFTETSLESQTNQTNIAILNPAVEPPDASSPKILLNVALSMLVGLMLGVGVAVALELADRRIRSVDDLKAWLELPVLGVLAKDPGRKKRLRIFDIFTGRGKRSSRAIAPFVEAAGGKMNILREGSGLLPRKSHAAHQLQERSIGAILIDEGKLSVQDAERILALQKRDAMRFGDAAVKLGLVAPEDIQHALSRQFDYPYLMPGDENVSPELVAAFSPFSKEVEALRLLRSQLMLRWFASAPERRALAVVSPGRGEGRSYLAANLAVVFSQLGERTLLIDADLRNPRQHELFRLQNKAGLSSMLAGRAEHDEVQRVQSFLDLSVLTAGAVPPNPVELLGRPPFRQMLDRFAAEYDVIILDTPAGADNADMQTIAVRAGAAAVVVRRHNSRAREAIDLISNLSAASVRLVGTILTSF